MEPFKRNIEDLIDFCFEKAMSCPDVDQLNLKTLKVFADNFSREVMMDQFIKNVLPNHEELHKREKPESLLILVPDDKMIQIFDNMSDEDRDEFWEIVTELVRSCIVYIHQMREKVDGKYTKKYASEFSVKKLSELWDVQLS